MKKKFDPQRNYEDTKKQIGYVSRKKAVQKDYDRIGFMSGLEVHQQLLTKKKLFCNCPAGAYNKSDDYDAELIRHMRPTLSELGEYDGTALMEFKTKKEIIYRIKNATTCTYEVDDTPPFPLNREALDIAIEISLLSKQNIVGEVHITRKQYLDGSIPTGFQRTAIIGVEGEIQLKHKKIRLIQLSLEEDSCREISDIGHVRVFKTDRLGMPLIETVTYPDCSNPDEVMETCDYIRFLNRSTGKVRTGIGAGREDVNVSCRGGSRVEIKGVAHTKWIPELTHKEAFRQWALLAIRDKLLERIKDVPAWKIRYEYLKNFACEDDINKVIVLLNAEDDDAQLIVWGPEEDLKTALETIEERCRMAFDGVPNETRKSFEDGTTIFERVLPGADRMYPDTDSPPIPLEADHIAELGENPPDDIIDRYHTMQQWGIPEDTYTYIFKKDLFPLIERIVNELGLDPKFVGTFFGHTLKFVEGHYTPSAKFNYKLIFPLFSFLKSKGLDYELIKKMMPLLYEYPKLEFESVLTTLKFKKIPKDEILSKIGFLKEIFEKTGRSQKKENAFNWIMGELRTAAVGNINMAGLGKEVRREMGEDIGYKV
ncbi:MAG: Glu-tRNA(Gln) amidotransferase GatDE subunit E [Bacteroidetes bacterium 4572_114]|nr:MAG: Glu-tRNA(Gln) amidotransferase GatDE subunit E [Bacteroidetes bacterium 4572_114]